MLDFRKQFQEIIEQSYIPFNIDKAATSDVWEKGPVRRWNESYDFS